MNERITDIDGLKIEIKSAFYDFSSRFGVFSSMPRKLEDLERKVLDAVRVYTEYVAPIQDKPKEPVCAHKWRDSEHWYFELSMGKDMVRYKIIEPYVCVFCKQRKNVVLEEGVEPAPDMAGAYEVIRRLKRIYPKLCDRAIVEDEINDAILVDREYLKILDSLRDARKPAKIELKLPTAKTEDSG